MLISKYTVNDHIQKPYKIRPYKDNWKLKALLSDVIMDVSNVTKFVIQTHNFIVIQLILTDKSCL